MHKNNSKKLPSEEWQLKLGLWSSYVPTHIYLHTQKQDTEMHNTTVSISGKGVSVSNCWCCMVWQHLQCKARMVCVRIKAALEWHNLTVASTAPNTLCSLDIWLCINFCLIHVQKSCYCQIFTTVTFSTCLKPVTYLSFTSARKQAAWALSLTNNPYCFTPTSTLKIKKKILKFDCVHKNFPTPPFYWNLQGIFLTSVFRVFFSKDHLDLNT